jgi:antitoxin Phd
MKNMWQLQEAKNKLSEVVDEAAHHGPQVITRRGVEVAVISGAKRKLSAFFRESPLAGVKLDLRRDRGSLREDIVL